MRAMRALPRRGSAAALLVAAGALAAGGQAAAWAKTARPPEPPSATDARQPEANAEVSTLGRVTYAAASVEVPISARVALVPSTELLYLSPVDSDPAREVHPYAGAGVVVEEPGDWDWDVELTYGPRAAGISSVGVAVGASKGLRAGGDGAAPERDPDLDLDLTLNATFFSWATTTTTTTPAAPSPIGPGVTQLYAESNALWRLSAAVHLRAQGMLFLYDQSLAPRTAEDVDALSVLARVGTYAPRALVGAHALWKASAAVAPLVELDEIVYAAGVGTATRLAAGARFDLGHGLRATLKGGLLHNVLSGVAAELDDARTVPLFEVEARLVF